MGKKIRITNLKSSKILPICLFLALPCSALKGEPGLDFYSKYQQAVKQEKESNILQAARLFTEAKDINPNDLDIKIKLGLLHLNSDAQGDLRQSSNQIALDYFSQAMESSKDDPMLPVLAARACEELGQRDRAIEYLLVASTLDPNNILLKERLGRLYFEKKDFKNSIEIFNKIVLAYPDSLKARSYLGAALQATDNYMSAIEQYNYVLNYSPDEFAVLKNLADSWLALKQYDKASEAYQRALQIDPKVPDVYADIAYLAHLQGDNAKAIDFYGQALERKNNPSWRKALAYALLADKKEDKAIEIFDEIQEYGLSGYVHQNKGNIAKAIDSYQKAIDLNPSDYKTRFNLASLYYDQVKLDQAKLQYQNILEQRPNDLESMFLLATIDQEQGRIDDAMTSYKQILTNLDLPKLDEEQKALKNNTRFNLALAYKSKSNLAKAEENFLEILKQENQTEKFTRSRDLFKELSFIKIALGKDIEAEKIINDWLRKEPTNVEARNLYADFLVHQSKNRQAVEQLRLASTLDKTIDTRLKLANLLHSQNNLYEALAEYQTIIKEEPQNLSALLGAANNFKSLGFREESINLYTQILKDYPNDVLANYNYGLLMQESKNFEDAKLHYEKVLALNPNFLQVYYVLGLIYYDMGDKAKAQEYWHRYMVDSPDENIKNQIKKLLESAPIS